MPITDENDEKTVDIENGIKNEIEMKEQNIDSAPLTLTHSSLKNTDSERFNIISNQIEIVEEAKNDKKLNLKDDEAFH